MKGYGDPLHFSVFRCHLSSRGKVELVAALTDIINHKDDRVMIIHLGPLEGEADRRIEYLGIHPKISDQSAIII
jgi:CRISPR-associated protein Cas2